MNKREKAIKLIEWFIPHWIKDWNDPKVIINDNLIGIEKILESEFGVDGEKAFFMKTEEGKLPENVSNKKRLRSLLWGQKWMAAQVKMWKEGSMEGAISKQDIQEEPEYIQEFINKTLWKTN